MQVLIVEDDSRMAALIAKGLHEEGFQVAVSHDGLEALSLAGDVGLKVIVLDAILPGIDGFEFVRRLRTSGVETPILMLTAKDSQKDIVRGLDLGADDYLTKPFGFEVFLARVRAAIRRGPVPHPTILRAGSLTLNSASREVRISGQYVALTKTEYSILYLLMSRPNHTIAREVILREIWGDTHDVKSNTLDAFMRLLRSKIEPISGRRLIFTIRRVGYVLRIDES